MKIILLTLGLILTGMQTASADNMPIITQLPVSQTVSVGAVVVLTVVATGNNLQYQWLFNGDIIPGAVGPSLTLTNVTTGSCGAYEAVVFNNAGAVNSTRAYILVAATALPLADSFANRGVINTATGLGNGSSQGATKEAADPKPGNSRVGSSVWLTWVAPTNGIAVFNTTGSAFDTVLGVYTGTSLSSLVEMASDDDGGGDHTSAVAFNAKTGTAYQIYVGSADQDGGSILFSWAMLPSTYPWPTNVTQLTNVTTLPGASATLSVKYATAAPVTVQWYHNGVAIPGATNKTAIATGTMTSLSWSQLTEADLGNYQVALTSPEWVWFLNPAEIQFNSQGTATAGARNKLILVGAP